MHDQRDHDQQVDSQPRPDVRKVDGFTVLNSTINPERLRAMADDDLTASGGARTVHLKPAHAR